MRVLVTGVAGFIGVRLATALLDRGDVVVGIDSFTDYYDPAIKRRNVGDLLARPGFTLVEADLLDGGWTGHLDDVEVVFHQAGQPGVRASWADGFDGYVDRNVRATQRLLEAVRGRTLSRLVYASSSSLYGDALTFPTREDVVPAPVSPYGVTKLAAEHLCLTYARNWAVPTISLRYFTVYGGGQRPDMAAHRMIEAARTGRPFPLFGDGAQQRDVTHVADVVAANLAAAGCDTDPGTVVNIAGGSSVTVTDLLVRVGEAVGLPVPVERQAAHPGDVRRTGADTGLARDLLGWVPTVTVEEGIAEQVAWHERMARNPV